MYIVNRADSLFFTQPQASGYKSANFMAGKDITSSARMLLCCLLLRLHFDFVLHFWQPANPDWAFQ